MNKEFLKNLYEHIEWNVQYYVDEYFDKDGTINNFNKERLEYYLYIKRILDSVISPLESIIPDKDDSNLFV